MATFTANTVKYDRPDYPDDSATKTPAHTPYFIARRPAWMWRYVRQTGGLHNRQSFRLPLKFVDR